MNIENSAENWKQLRKIGKRNYVLTVGLSLKSPLMFIALYIISRGQMPWVTAFSISIIYGFLDGIGGWNSKEKEFSLSGKHTEKMTYVESLRHVASYIFGRLRPNHYFGYNYLGEDVTLGRWLYSRVDGGPDRRYHNNKRLQTSIKSWKHLESGNVEIVKVKKWTKSYGDLR